MKKVTFQCKCGATVVVKTKKGPVDKRCERCSTWWTVKPDGSKKENAAKSSGISKILLFLLLPLLLLLPGVAIASNDVPQEDTYYVRSFYDLNNNNFRDNFEPFTVLVKHQFCNSTQPCAEQISNGSTYMQFVSLNKNELHYVVIYNGNEIISVDRIYVGYNTIPIHGNNIQPNTLFVPLVMKR